MSINSKPRISGLSGNEIYCMRLKGFEPVGIVVGNSVRSMGFLGGLTSGMRGIIGGEIPEITQIIHDGRQSAYDRMVAEVKQGSAHDEFLATYIGKNDTAFRASWRSLVFSGQATMPKSFDSEAAVVEYVAHTAGAIGYIGKATPHEGVKVLAVR